ncbi:MAG: hypothetical protein EOP20_00680 [Hyphomicrobiales bacterium]|nr:MAG: hypothetical protein EOP20_00680 [Hyphomicrobiales bacterium]
MTDKPAKRSATPLSELKHRWYFKEWAILRGKIQADADRELGWPRAKTQALWNGKQRYTQDSVDEAALWLDVAPYELLMDPAEAMQLRQIREAARLIAGK